MKNRTNLKKISKRNVHKRRGKDKARRELLSSLSSLGVNCGALKFVDKSDSTRRGTHASGSRREQTVRGIFSSSRSGFGFVRAEGRADIFIPEGRTHGAVDGDLVEAAYTEFTDREGRERTDGRVTAVLEEGRSTVIGTLIERISRHGRRVYRYYVLKADDPSFLPEGPVTDTLGARDNDKVEARLIRSARDGLSLKVIRNFGPCDSRDANYSAILSEFGIETEFSPEVQREAREAAAEPISLEGRADLRGDIIFTIDGAGAKDLDDAVSLRRLPGGKWRLGVHIADVAHYVKERTALDRAAMSRATSVYFTDKVVPMLPRELSNGACSLNAGEEKYALSAEIDLGVGGEILSLELRESVIKSRVRGVYSEVNALFSGEVQPEIKKKYKEVTPALLRMRELYRVLKKKNDGRSGLDFDAPECEIILDERGEVKDILPRERGEAERLIEQFMLTANEAVAAYLYKKDIPCVYRVHSSPPEDKLGSFITYMHNLGFDTSLISKREAPSAKQLSALLSAAGERGLSSQVSYTLLRSMAKAEYSDKKSGHFGLGIEDYCHFTSPIRRLSDLVTHRIIKNTLFLKKSPASYRSLARRAAAAASEGEVRAMGAERRIEDLYKAVYMSAFVGESFSASVSSVTRFGLFCTLDNTCEGLIPISEMPGEFVFDEGNLTLRSRDRIYSLADRLCVRLAEADISRGKLRFELVEE